MPHPLQIRSTSAPPGGATYYLDATGGSDSAHGRSPDAAWQTLGKVNAATFRAGDRVLLKRGETWTGTQLTPQSGVLYADYGSGAKPVLDGNLTTNGVVATGLSRVTFQNIRAVNGLDFGFLFTTCDRVTLVDCEADNAGNDGCLFLTGCTRGVVIRGIFSNSRNRTGTYVSTGIEISDGGTDFLIDGAECFGSVMVGIGVHNHAATDPQGHTQAPQNVTIRNCNLHANTTHGIQFLLNDTSGAFNAVVENCTIASNTAQGIAIIKAAGGTTYPDTITVRGCTLDANGSHGVNDTGGAGHLYHHNLIKLPSNQTVNLGVPTGVLFYNNTIYSAGTAGSTALFTVTGSGSTGTFKNNLLIAGATGNFLMSFAAGTTGWVADYNWYRTTATTGLTRWKWAGTNVTYANWLVNSAQDAHSTAFTDPLVVSVPSDLTLQAGSPLINAGVVVAGITDGYLGAAPDVGFAERL